MYSDASCCLRDLLLSDEEDEDEDEDEDEADDEDEAVVSGAAELDEGDEDDEGFK